MRSIWKTIKSYPNNNTICFTAYDNVSDEEMLQWLMECMPEFDWAIEGQVATITWPTADP